MKTMYAKQGLEQARRASAGLPMDERWPSPRPPRTWLERTDEEMDWEVDSRVFTVCAYKIKVP